MNSSENDTSPAMAAETASPSSSATPSSQEPIPTPVKRFRTLAERKTTLEEDPWIDSTKVFPKKVRCLGCGNDVKLDMRAGADYYPAPWNKHKVACVYVREGRRKGVGDIIEGILPRKKMQTGAQQSPPTLPVTWSTESLEGGGSTLQSTGELLRALGNRGDLLWGGGPSTDTGDIRTKQ